MSSNKATEAESASKATPRPARLCGNCGKPGHNRRTCPELVVDTKQLEQYEDEGIPRESSFKYCLGCGNNKFQTSAGTTLPES